VLRPPLVCPRAQNLNTVLQGCALAVQEQGFTAAEQAAAQQQPLQHRQAPAVAMR
jgi:hypothetical protein